MTPAQRPRRTATARSPPSTPPAPAAAGFPLGRSGAVHPPIGLGLWSLGRWTKEDEAKTRAVAAHGLEAGVRWFDTAEVYGTGRSERILGDLLGRARGSVTDAFVTTKLSWEHLRPAQVRPSLLGSLQRLGLGRVDLYLVHAPDPQVPLETTMPALEALWKEGKVGALGVSNFGVEELEAARGGLKEAELVVNQIRFNLFERSDTEPVLDYCRRHGILVEAYAPLARGLLTGRYLDGRAPPEIVRRAARDLFQQDHLPELLRRARGLRDLAADAKVPMASLALHWLARQGVAPLFGATRPEQVDQVLEAWSRRPTDAVLDRADAIARGADA